MTNTDIVFWSANGTSSFCQDLWGNAKRKPLIDPYNAYTTKFTVNDDDSVLFKSVRELDPGLPDTFVIQLDTPVPMIAAYKTSTSGLSYHGSVGRFYWTLVVESGHFLSKEVLEIEEVEEVEDLNEELKALNETRIELPRRTFNSRYRDIPAIAFLFNPETKIITFIAEVPVGMWLSIGFGRHMFETDMILM